MHCLEQQSRVGGGIYAEGGSSSTVKVYAENSILQGNSAGAGGGMYIDDATVTLTSTTFASLAGGDGGGMRIEDATVTLTNITFASNLMVMMVVVCIYMNMEIAVRSTCDRAVSSPMQHQIRSAYIHGTHQQ